MGQAAGYAVRARRRAFYAAILLVAPHRLPTPMMFAPTLNGAAAIKHNTTPAAPIQVAATVHPVHDAESMMPPHKHITP